MRPVILRHDARLQVGDNQDAGPADDEGECVGDEVASDGGSLARLAAREGVVLACDQQPAARQQQQREREQPRVQRRRRPLPSEGEERVGPQAAHQPAAAALDQAVELGARLLPQPPRTVCRRHALIHAHPAERETLDLLGERVDARLEFAREPRQEQGEGEAAQREAKRHVLGRARLDEHEALDDVGPHDGRRHGERARGEAPRHHDCILEAVVPLAVAQLDFVGERLESQDDLGSGLGFLFLDLGLG